MSRSLYLPVALAVMALPSAANAVSTTFAQFSQFGNQRIIFYDGGGTASAPTARLYTTTPPSTTFRSPLVRFNYNIPVGPAELEDDQNAFFSLDARSTTRIAADGSQLFSGNFSFIRSTPASVGDGNRNNLLSGTFTNARLFGTTGGTSLSFQASTPSSTINYSSDFLSFVNTVSQDFALSFSGATPRLTRAANGVYRDFRANVTGTFASDPAPVSIVPEPATWAMLIAGFGMVGFAVRRRRGDMVSVAD